MTGLLAALPDIPVEEIVELEFLDPFQQGESVPLGTTTPWTVTTVTICFVFFNSLIDTISPKC